MSSEKMVIEETCTALSEPESEPEMNEKHSSSTGSVDDPISHATYEYAQPEYYAESTTSSDLVDPEARPEVFKSTLHEVAAVLILTFSTVMNTISTGVMQIAVPTLGREFNISGGDLSWSVSSFQLMSATTILLFSGMADRIGRKRLVIVAYAWFAIWCLAGSFTTHHIVFDVCRGMQGLAAAACPSAGVGILGSTYKNGRRKNRVMAIFNAGSPFGLFLGIVTGGVTIEYITWRSIFYLYTIIFTILTVLVIFVVPGDNINDNIRFTPKEMLMRIKDLDWTGAALSTVGCIMFVFAASQAASATSGWATPYVIIVLILSFVVLAGFVYWEMKCEKPLMPLQIWKFPGFATIMVLVLFAWMCFTGVLNFYGGLYLQNVMGASPLKAAFYLFPQILASAVAVTIISAILHIAPGRLILIVAQMMMIGASLLWALVPLGTPYAAMILPALCLAIIAADLTYNVVNMHTLSAVSKAEQSSAAGIFYTINHLAGSLGVSLSSSIVSSILRRNAPMTTTPVPMEILSKAYKGAFWFATGLSSMALVCAVFANIGKQGAHEEAVVPDIEGVACVLKPGEKTCGVRRRGSSGANSSVIFDNVDADANEAGEMCGLLVGEHARRGYDAVL
ncbi:major facilitator superfamily domain-containing protein [Myxozyma melibiosi]|uniref:Major facilitator superfamily domain-containing protein n=1 Tax=Myxozyma melibiosi TaxID=54550 RepID=A0ABR1F2I1_9ASCO